MNLEFLWLRKLRIKEEIYISLHLLIPGLLLKKYWKKKYTVKFQNKNREIIMGQSEYRATRKVAVAFRTSCKYEFFESTYIKRKTELLLPSKYI